MNKSDSDNQKRSPVFPGKIGSAAPGEGLPHFFPNRALLRVNPALDFHYYQSASAALMRSAAYVCVSVPDAVAALHKGAPGQMTWLEDPPPWLRPAYCFASVIAVSYTHLTLPTNREV